MAGERGPPSRALGGGEKGAGSSVRQLRLAGTRPFVREHPSDGRHLGPVSAGHLRGCPASHRPPAGAPCKRARRWQHHFPYRVAPDRPGMAPATRGARSDRGWGEVSGTRNRDRECRASVARPLTSSTSGDCPGRKATSGRSMAVVPPASFADRDARAVHSRARGGIHLQKSQERVWPCARPRKRTTRGLVDVLHIDEDARQMHRPASRSNAKRRALARALRAVSRDGRHLDPWDAAAIDVPAANRGSGDWSGIRLAVFQAGRRTRGVRGSRSTEPLEAEKAPALPRKARRAMWQSIGPKPARVPSSTQPLEAEHRTLAGFRQRSASSLPR
jgi:hypothetical protein